MRIRHLAPLALAAALAGCNISVSTGPKESLPPATAGTASQQEDAFQAAKNIIHSMDRGEFGMVWDRSSPILKSSSFKTVFTKLMSATRGNLGKASPRGSARIGFAKKIDTNLPEGDYAIVEVDTDFSGKTVTEKLVMARESGHWKLAGYFMNSHPRINAGS